MGLLKIVHINDIYVLENYPKVKALVDKEGATLVTLGGDFLAPYLLSTLDHGAGTMEILNAIGVSHTIFGNHETDIPHSALLERIDEFRGCWLNSNFPKFPKKMPEYDIVEFDGKKIGIFGILSGDPKLYRDSSFRGLWKTIESPEACVKRMVSKLKNCDILIAMTHLDASEDERLAQFLPAGSLILGGHDHSVLNKEIHGVHLVKAGQNAEHAALVEIIGEEIKTTIISLDGAAPEEATIRKLVDRHSLKVAALDRMYLSTGKELRTQLFARPSSLKMPLSSKNTRAGPSSFATMVCSVIKWELDCECAVIEGGSVRGNREYKNGFTFADLKTELPFENATAVAAIPGSVLSAMIAESRSKESRASAFYLHLDADCAFKDGKVTHIDAAPLDPERVYSVAVGMDLTFGSKVNETMIRYATKFPNRIPTLDQAIGAKTIILAFFSQRFWTRLPTFDTLDKNSDGVISYEELHAAYTSAFSTEKSDVDFMTRQLIAAFDKDDDGQISRDEYELIFSRHRHRHFYSGCAVRRSSCPTWTGIKNSS